MTPKEFFDQFKTHQQIYEYVVRKLWEQGEISFSAGICRYRDPHNRKCAIGQFIPDECYTEEKMEGLNFDQIIDAFYDTMDPDHSDMVSFFNRFSTNFKEGKFVNFFIDMQTHLHDLYYNPASESRSDYREYLKNASKGFADQYGLAPYIFIE
jgi:hypothetical protein